MQSVEERFWVKSYPEGVPLDIYPDKYPNLVALMDEAFSEHPYATAYTCMGKSLTFKKVKEYAEKVAQFLINEGFYKGDRVAVMLPNILQNPIVILGVLKGFKLI